MTDYDISLLFDSQVKWSQMHDVIAQGIRENGLLHGADFVDEYRGKQVPAGKKSVTIRLTIGPWKDPDLHGDRGGASGVIRSFHQAPRGASCAPGKIRFSSLQRRKNSVY